MDFEEYFRKTIDFVIKEQKAQGIWSKRIKHNEPRELFRRIVPTKEAVETLIYTGAYGNSKVIKAGIKNILDYELEEADPLELWATKLRIAEIANNKEIIKEISKWLRNKNILSTRLPMLFSMMLSEAIGENIDLIKKLKKARARDGKGWGRIVKDSKSYITFTSNAVIALILAGENPNETYLQKARIFIEKSQNKNGSWNSSPETLTKPTTYATALAVQALMLLSKNPFNKAVNNGISYLLKTAHKKGGWPLIKNEEPEIYTTMYAVKTLRFYNYLKENNEEYLSKFLTPQQLSCYLFKKFTFDYPKEKLIDICIKDLLSSKAIAATPSAIKRRRDIIKILMKHTLDVAGIIDKLNQMGYHLNKKSHMTQIKFDVEHLREMNLIDRIKNRYFVVVDLGF